MIVLHAWWSSEGDSRGQLVVWAEDSEAPAQPPVRRGRRPAQQAHPFAVSVPLLALATALDGTPGTAVLTLPTPTPGRGPAASVELTRMRDQSPPLHGSLDARWEVPTLAVDPLAAVAYLLAAPGGSKSGHGLKEDVPTIQRWVAVSMAPTRAALPADRERHKLVLAAEAHGLMGSIVPTCGTTHELLVRAV